MANYRQEDAVMRWAGTIPDLQRLAQAAEQAITDWTKSAETTVTISQTDGRTSNYESIDVAVADLREFKLSEVERIHVRTAATQHSLGPYVSIAFSTRLVAVLLTVEGDDRTRVDGIHKRISQLANRGRPWPDAPATFLWIGTAIALAVMLVPVINFEISLLHKAHLASGFQEWAIFGCIGATIWLDLLIVNAVHSLFPTLELVLEGQPTRATRSWGMLGLLLVGVISSLIASAIWVIATSGR